MGITTTHRRMGESEGPSGSRPWAYTVLGVVQGLGRYLGLLLAWGTLAVLPLGAQETWFWITNPPRSIRPGDLALVYLASQGNLDTLSLRPGPGLDGSAMAIHSPVDAGSRLGVLLLGIVPWQDPGSYRLDLLDSGGRVIHRLPVRVENRVVPLERLKLGAAMTSLRRDPDPNKTRQSQELAALLKSPSAPGACPATLGSGRFPLDGVLRRTSWFMEQRHWDYDDGSTASSTHWGEDFAGYRVPVRSPLAGLVRMSGFRILTGNTVVLEHVPGLMSLYYHLDGPGPAKGSILESGSLLGATGASGLVTGAHLHWELRHHGIPLDPESLILGQGLDTEGLKRVFSLAFYP